MLFGITSKAFVALGLLALSAFANDLDERQRHGNGHGGGHGGNRQCTNLKGTSPSGRHARTISLRRGQTSKVLTSEYTSYTGCWAPVSSCAGTGMRGYGDVEMEMTFDTSVKAYLVSMDSANGELKLTYPVVNHYAAYMLVPKAGYTPPSGKCGYQAAVMINTTQTTTSGMNWFARPANPPQPAVGAGTQVTDGSALYKINSVTAFKDEASLRAAVPNYNFIMIMSGVPGDNTKRDEEQ